MTTTADTDDTNPRLAALESDVRNINVQLERMHVEQQESRREHAAGRRRTGPCAPSSRRKSGQTNARIDQTNGKIDQVSEQLNAKIDQVSAQLNAKIDQKIERLTYFLLGGMVTLLAGFALLYFRTGG